MATETQKAKRQQKPRRTATGDWLYCNFSARPEEIAKWKELAQADRRSLSFWIRDVLNKTVAAIEFGATAGNSTVDVEPSHTKEQVI